MPGVDTVEVEEEDSCADCCAERDKENSTTIDGDMIKCINLGFICSPRHGSLSMIHLGACQSTLPPGSLQNPGDNVPLAVAQYSGEA